MNAEPVKSKLGQKLQQIIDDPVCRYHTRRTAWRVTDTGSVYSLMGDPVEFTKGGGDRRRVAQGMTAHNAASLNGAC